MAPTQVTVTDITGTTATIEWQVSSPIAYTPQIYVVEYGSDENNLDLSSEVVQSWSVQLHDLMPFTTYYIRVISMNSVGNTSSEVSDFTAEASSKWKSLLKFKIMQTDP